MSAKKTTRVNDILGLINGLYPPALAEDWDNVGLQVGDGRATVNRVLVCLDPGAAALQQAEQMGAQMVIAHHPLIFRPLKRLSPVDETGQVLFRAVQQGIAVVSAHTNLDRAADGLNDWLAERLGLQQATPLEQAGGDLLKLVVYVPRGHEEKVLDSLFGAGAGQVGDYDRCSFRVAGTGSFRPGAGTDPFIGQPGTTETVEEVRLETILPKHLLRKAVSKMIQAHPYEEVAYDLIPLNNGRHDIGLGRIGWLPQPVSVAEFSAQIKERLGLSALRLAGPTDRPLKKIAVCGGSGVSLFGEARRQGADCLVTGDVKYHDAQRARSEGMLLVDAGHFATEHLMVAGLAKKLQVAADDRQLPVEFIEMNTEVDPFELI
ncbi:MAG: Nif3-like dinuclear metal center hexameric protein [Desulfuromonas sp.]|nr:MAG: Nif3-like dinuclear metal center hexameric protein [Desulfuromonas sp.]